MSTLPPLDPTYADSVFDELADMDVQLDSDPLQYGPKRLQGKIALVRKKLSRCERIFLDVSQKHSRYKRGLRSSTLLLEMSKKHLLANDPEVRAGRAVSERDAIASGKLKDEVQAVANCENAVAEIDAVIAVVKAKRSDLRDIQGRLRDQMRLCQEEIGLGARWGSKSPRSIELEPGQGVATGADIADVNAVIAATLEVTGEALLEAEVDDTDPEPEQEESLAVSAEEVESTKDPLNVPAPEVPLVDEDEDYEMEPVDQGVSAASVLPGTTSQDDLKGFFSTDMETLQKPSRRQIEEADTGLDIDSILANFDG